MIIIRKAAPGISEQALARFAQRARKAAGLRGQVNVVLTSSRDMRALNRRFLGKDRPTDVLSFPPLPVVAEAFSGDIVISTDIACRNARLYQHAPAQELKILILHGMLHLAGYDHESDGGEMARFALPANLPEPSAFYVSEGLRTIYSIHGSKVVATELRA